MHHCPSKERLLQELAHVHDRIDHGDLVCAKELLERRRREGVESVVSEVVGGREARTQKP